MTKFVCLSIAVLIGMSGCDTSKPKPKSETKAKTKVAAKGNQKPQPTHASDALRCAECHGEMTKDWRKSTHAQADRSPAYKKTRAESGTPAACDRCHAPLRGIEKNNEVAVAEGVTCDACHTIQGVHVQPDQSDFRVHVEDLVKYSTLCNAENHYFHKMGCSPLHGKADFCSSCHHLNIKTPSGKKLAVFTTYEDWKSGPYNKPGEVTPCQTCHMPDPEDPREIATGGPEREEVPHHGFLGEDWKLRTQALSMNVEVSQKGNNRLSAKVQVINDGAGHSVPAGLPAKRIVLRIRTISAKGREHAKKETVFGRTLVDAEGKIVPFYLAETISADTRIKPDQSKTETHELDCPRAGKVEIQLVWQRIAPELLEAYGEKKIEEEVLLSATVPFGAPSSGKRSGLPKSLEIQP